MTAATEQGRICALVARGQRDLQRCASGHPDLFPADPFDATLFSSIAMAIAFGAPWCTEAQLRLTNRTVLWGFAVDWLVDRVATSAAEVDRLAEAALAVADGAAPPTDQPLARFLAELRDELATSPTYPARYVVWRAELARMLGAMAREWVWKTRTAATGTAATRTAATGAGDTAGRPSLDEYLDNADNLGATFVNVTHWIHTGDPTTAAHLDDLVTASTVVQQVLRLVNDLGTYERDLRWGDLNALLLVADRAEVRQRIDTLVDRARELLAPLTVSCPVQAAYLARQLGYSSGFYRTTDFWGVR
ncbi:terpene synthase family protein [Micromonospora echinofusca]|uniref:Terpene synthase n=1 Tax=Micromonospora echinofusca TaxID=47858 RepID=A0ABS3VRQ4_MICEH|nr:terpene synthase family protein [Micromonospora echinofusca]MBO4207064.1 terpene synthase [Micromonospora echinofusca]